MIISTTEKIPGKEVSEVLGIAKGSTIRAKNIGRDILAGLKQIVGGELEGYTQMLEESREQAIQRMVKEAEEKGADAIIGVRLDSSSVMQNAAEIVAYGTAVKLS